MNWRTIAQGWRPLGLISLTVVGACTSPVEKAEQRYAIVDKSGDAAALCAEGAKLADAYLQAGDADKYNARKLSADIACTSRRLDEQIGVYRMPDGTSENMRADNLEALPDNTSTDAR